MCSENKGADQLHGYREADLRLCFRICKKPVFSQRGLILAKDLTKEQLCKYTTIQDKSGKCISEEPEILNRWTGLSYLYNYDADGDPTLIYCPQILPDEEPLPFIREEVEATVKALKMGKSARVDNIPAELVKARGYAMNDVLTSVCNKKSNNNCMEAKRMSH